MVHDNVLLSSYEFSEARQLKIVFGSVLNLVQTLQDSSESRKFSREFLFNVRRTFHCHVRLACQSRVRHVSHALM